VDPAFKEEVRYFHSPFLPFSSMPYLFISLVAPLLFQLWVWRSTVSSPSGVWGTAPAAKTILAYLQHR